MFSWLQFAIALLKIGNSIILYFQQQSLINAGYDKAIAEQALKTLGMTKRGKAIMEQVNAMDEAAVDDGLRGLEPPAGSVRSS